MNDWKIIVASIPVLALAACATLTDPGGQPTAPGAESAAIHGAHVDDTASRYMLRHTA